MAVGEMTEVGNEVADRFLIVAVASGDAEGVQRLRGASRAIAFMSPRFMTAPRPAGSCPVIDAA